MKIDAAQAYLASLDKLLPQTSAAIKQAMVDVTVHNHTWRLAARVNDVTESGILRAMQRAKKALQQDR